MAKPFRGVVNLDIRDSIPDWGPYEQPKAPPGSPNVLYIVLDDVGYGAWAATAARSRPRTSTRSPRTGCGTGSGTPPRCVPRPALAC